VTESRELLLLAVVLLTLRCILVHVFIAVSRFMSCALSALVASSFERLAIGNEYILWVASCSHVLSFFLSDSLEVRLDLVPQLLHRQGLTLRIYHSRKLLR
jgi:hypothetical protein